MASPKYARISDIQALRVRVDEIDRNTIDHLNRILEALASEPEPEIIVRPPEPPTTPPIVIAPAYPWGHHTEGRTLTEAVGLLNAARNTFPQHQLIIEQIAWEIFKEHDPAWRSLRQGVRGFMEAAERRGMPPSA